MHHLLRWYRQVARLLLAVLIASAIPGANGLEQASSALAASTDALLPASPVALTIAPVADTHLPSLTLRLTVNPDPVAVGDTAALTITVTNDAPDPAENLVVTLPAPDGALALPGPNTLNPVQGWQWNVGHLDGQSSTTLVGTLRLARRPAGDALLLHAQATASGLDLPIQEVSGALVIDRTLGPATVSFIPGVAARLHSADGRVDVQFPARAFARGLTLRHGRTPLTDALPPAGARFTRGFGAFFLDATDAQGIAVHQFSQPVTITVGYTPEQLQARGIAESDLTLTWFNPTTQSWETIPTAVDPATQTATVVVNHFTPFELGDGSSASDAFIPSVQGFQVSSFTGAASYAYPFDVPAGPAGIKPSLSLSYSSAATDGVSGERVKQQASWVGKGWSLDTGSVARNKLPNGDATYALILDGQSYTLVRGAARLALLDEQHPGLGLDDDRQRLPARARDQRR
jgi:uncharacterized repeat protein (TIGR01451 family)